MAHSGQPQGHLTLTSSVIWIITAGERENGLRAPMFRPFGRCTLAPPCAPSALPAKSCLSWLPRFHPPGPNQLLPSLSPLLSLFPWKIWWPLFPIPLPRPLPLSLRFLLPPLPLRTLLPPLPPLRLHHRSWILQPLALSYILLFPSSLPPLLQLAPTATLREPPFPLPQPHYSLSNK